MTSIRIAFALAGALLIIGFIGVRPASAEAASCQAQLKEQDARCQELAEKLAEACPSGTNIKETAQCRELSNQIAGSCTRKPCGPPPRKGKRGKGKATGMGTRRGAGMRGMGTPRKN